jgi:hypothetical protein
MQKFWIRNLIKQWRFLINIKPFQCFTYVVPGKKNALQVNNLQSALSISRDPAGIEFPPDKTLFIIHFKTAMGTPPRIPPLTECCYLDCFKVKN